MTEFAELYQQALEQRVKALGPGHPKVAESATDLGLYLRDHGDRAAAFQYLSQALAIRETPEALENLASVSQRSEALRLFRRAVELRAQDLRLAETLKQLASLDESQAAQLYRQALALEEKLLPAKDLRLAGTLNNLALAIEESEPKQAEALFRRALSILPPDHPEAGTTLNNLASLLLGTGRLPAAETAQRRALSVLRASLGDTHERVAVAVSNMADIHRAKGELAAAEKLYREALAIDERVYGANHPEVAADLENLASLLEQRGRGAAARPLRERAQAIGR